MVKLEIRKMSRTRKLKMITEIKEKSRIVAKFSGKLEFLALKKFNIRTSCNFRILPT